MYRGILLLTTSEMNHAVIALKATNQPVHPNTIQKFTPHYSDPNHQYKIETNDEEAEILLDNLPIPDVNEDQNIKSLRTKIQQFITKARQQ